MQWSNNLPDGGGGPAGQVSSVDCQSLAGEHLRHGCQIPGNILLSFIAAPGPEEHLYTKTNPETTLYGPPGRAF